MIVTVVCVVVLVCIVTGRGTLRDTACGDLQDLIQPAFDALHLGEQRQALFLRETALFDLGRCLLQRTASESNLLGQSAGGLLVLRGERGTVRALRFIARVSTAPSARSKGHADA